MKYLTEELGSTLISGGILTDFVISVVLVLTDLCPSVCLILKEL